MLASSIALNITKYVTLGQYILIEALKFLGSLGLLYLTWVVGQKITAEWELKRKRKELDIQLTVALQNQIGEWKTTWRMWKALLADPNIGTGPPNSERRWNLLEKASAGEGAMEAAILRLVTERLLSEYECRQIGLFRQAFQQLREAIRDNIRLEWTRGDREYWQFHRLAVRTLDLMNRELPATSMTVTDAERQLSWVLSVKKSDWDQHLDTN